MPNNLAESLERLKLGTNQQGNQTSILRLIAEAVVEHLKIRRLELEEKSRRERVQELNSRAMNNRRGRGKSGDRPRQEQEEQPRDGRRGRSADRRSNYTPLVTGPSLEEQPEDPRYMMAGGAREAQEPNSADTIPRRRRHRRNRSPSLGPVPKYKPKLGLTLGMMSFYKECCLYYVADREKEARRQLRKAHRDARKKDAPEGHRFEHAEVGSSRRRSERGESPPRLVYEQTPHSHAVENRERAQAEQEYGQHVPAPGASHQQGALSRGDDGWDRPPPGDPPESSNSGLESGGEDAPDQSEHVPFRRPEGRREAEANQEAHEVANHPHGVEERGDGAYVLPPQYEDERNPEDMTPPPSWRPMLRAGEFHVEMQD
ncbi:hypothetical protein EJ04DRAFT_113304 [Polyplosphaeria fusca]|uniref:Uncharacterized protein n=1 Tax=Polyplosphaeria fusca TaxID=682080 RepID=A0A9P4V9Y9_9PLEO|nr:hypothetical protein EJ04DRAFT_113304 [Polyplosphaeria fusca]